MVTAFMGLTSTRDVTVSRTLSTRTESSPTYFLPTDPTRCHISSDSLLRIGRNAAEANMAGYQQGTVSRLLCCPPTYCGANR
jgi:hypothetical protein